MSDEVFGDYPTLLAAAGDFHGHVCTGIAIGTRMTMSGLARIGISDPKGADRKKLMVFVEVDRCTTDAIMALTGCRPGKRTMKIRDYGKMAATFINLETGRAVRVATTMKAKPAEGEGVPDLTSVPEAELFTIADVAVPLRPEDMPGKPLRRVRCDTCGETILDGREVVHRGCTLCKPCHDGADYYRRAEETSDVALG